MTEPKDAIWDTGFDYERQEPPKSRPKVYCPLCLHPVVRHEPKDGSCGDCDCKGEDWYRGYQ